MSEITDKIRSRGHWEVTVRPEDFVAERVSYAALADVLEGVVVRFRGWPVPMIDRRERFLQGDDWIGQDINAALVSHYEAWRFFTSGQFTHLRAVNADWRDHREATRIPAGLTSVVEVWEILFFLTETFEVAARLSLAGVGGDRTVIEASLYGLEGRGLVVGQRDRHEFFQPYTTTLASITRNVTLDQDRLVANARQEAVTMAQDFFARFGWNTTTEQLTAHQQELTDS